MSEVVVPPPPETVQCPKCFREVQIVSTQARTMTSECPIPDCPITTNPENQPGQLWGTSISFGAPSEISQQGRLARFAEWEKIGVDRIKADLLSGGYRLVGGPPAVRALAEEWVRVKEAEAPSTPKPSEVLILKPTLWGMGIDLRALWQKLRGRKS